MSIGDVHIDTNILLGLLGIGLIVSWLGGKLDLKAVIAKFVQASSADRPPSAAHKPTSLGATTANDVKLAIDRLAIVTAKVDEMESTRRWLKQAEDDVRKEIALVRSCADAVESRLTSLKSSPGESPS